MKQIWFPEKWSFIMQIFFKKRIYPRGELRKRKTKQSVYMIQKMEIKNEGPVLTQMIALCQEVNIKQTYGWFMGCNFVYVCMF